MAYNTSSRQDMKMEGAKDAIASAASDVVDGLLGIIEELDGRLTEANEKIERLEKEAAG